MCGPPVFRYVAAGLADDFKEALQRGAQDGVQSDLLVGGVGAQLSNIGDRVLDVSDAVAERRSPSEQLDALVPRGASEPLGDAPPHGHLNGQAEMVGQVLLDADEIENRKTRIVDIDHEIDIAIVARVVTSTRAE